MSSLYSGTYPTSPYTGPLSTTAATVTGTSAITPSIIVCETDAHFNADIKLKGNSLTETIKNLQNGIAAIQERLNILVPSPELEKEWQELHKLGEQYRQLEKEILQKMAVFNELKK